MIDWLTRVYGIEVADWGEDRGPGLLISAGSGLMMSAMDHLPMLRWSMDLDVLPARQREVFPRWLRCVEACTARLAVCGWYCSTSPALLAQATGGLRRRHSVYVQFHGVGPDLFSSLRTADTLGEFIDQVQQDTLTSRQRKPNYAESSSRRTREDA